MREGLYRGESLEKVKGSVKPFDWTFTTDYPGTLTGHIQVCTVYVMGERSSAGAGGGDH